MLPPEYYTLQAKLQDQFPERCPFSAGSQIAILTVVALLLLLALLF